MFSLLSQRPARHGRSRRLRPTLDALEDRQLMSIATSPFEINTKTAGYQLDDDNATSADGNTVVVWDDQSSAGDFDVHAQRYNSFGGKLGPEIVVANTSNDETQPSVAINNAGQFVVSYTQVVHNDINVLAQRFDSSGRAVGSAIQVATSGFQESDSDVGIDDQDDFVVAYDFSAYGGSFVRANQYNSAGQLTKAISVTSSFADQYYPSVAMSPDGRFYVAWEQEYSGTDFDVYANSYNAAGTLTSAYIVADGTANDQLPNISADDNGNAVVVWNQGGNVEARRLGLGTIGPVISIADYSKNQYYKANIPSVALNQQGGGFVVAYTSVITDPGREDNGENVQVVYEVSASNTVTVQSPIIFESYDPSVSIDAFGDYFITDVEYNGTDTDVFGRRGNLATNPIP
jgi:hypothetical protein